MKAENKELLWAASLVVTILATIWSLFFIESLMPVIPAPEGVVHWHSGPWYYFVLLFTVIIVGGIVFFLLLANAGRERKYVIAYGTTLIGFAWTYAVVDHIIPVISYERLWFNVRPWYHFPAMFQIVFMLIITLIILHLMEEDE